MKKYSIVAVFLMMVSVPNGLIKADCFFYANDIKDDCRGRTCKNGQCICRYFYQEYHEEAGTKCVPVSIEGAAPGDVEAKCTRWRLMDRRSREQEVGSTIQRGTLAELKRREPTCTGCGHDVTLHIYLKDPFGSLENKVNQMVTVGESIISTRKTAENTRDQAGKETEFSKAGQLVNQLKNLVRTAKRYSNQAKRIGGEAREYMRVEPRFGWVETTKFLKWFIDDTKKIIKEVLKSSGKETEMIKLLEREVTAIVRGIRMPNLMPQVEQALLKITAILGAAQQEKNRVEQAKQELSEAKTLAEIEAAEQAITQAEQTKKDLEALKESIKNIPSFGPWKNQLEEIKRKILQASKTIEDIKKLSREAKVIAARKKRTIEREKEKVTKEEVKVTKEEVAAKKVTEEKKKKAEKKLSRLKAKAQIVLDKVMLKSGKVKTSQAKAESEVSAKTAQAAVYNAKIEVNKLKKHIAKLKDVLAKAQKAAGEGTGLEAEVAKMQAVLQQAEQLLADAEQAAQAAQIAADQKKAEEEAKARAKEAAKKAALAVKKSLEQKEEGQEQITQAEEQITEAEEQIAETEEEIDEALEQAKEAVREAVKAQEAVTATLRKIGVTPEAATAGESLATQMDTEEGEEAKKFAKAAIAKAKEI